MDLLAGWARINDQVNVWYDSDLVSPAMIARTEEAIRDRNIPNLALKNIRELKLVRDNARIFSSYKEGQYLPVYYRVDLAGVMVLFTLAESGEIGVYADFDMAPVSKDELFDPETRYRLKKYGIVMADKGALGFENGFQIIAPYNRNLLNAIKTAIIDTNIKRAGDAMDSGKVFSPQNPGSDLKNMAQMIYSDYTNMFHLFYASEGWGNLVCEQKKPYRHVSLEPFIRQNKLTLVDIESHIYNPCGQNNVTIPTKEVNLPPAKLNYADH